MDGLSRLRSVPAAPITTVVAANWTVAEVCCLSGCLPACLSVCLFACLPAYLPACHLPVCLPACLAYLPASMSGLVRHQVYSVFCILISLVRLETGWLAIG